MSQKNSLEYRKVREPTVKGEPIIIFDLFKGYLRVKSSFRLVKVKVY